MPACAPSLLPLQVHALGCSFTCASWLWYCSFDWGVFEMRGLMRFYKLAASVWQDVKALVVNPQALVAAAGQVRALSMALAGCS
jgi:hypothetical protein